MNFLEGEGGKTKNGSKPFNAPLSAIESAPVDIPSSATDHYSGLVGGFLPLLAQAARPRSQVCPHLGSTAAKKSKFLCSNQSCVYEGRTQDKNLRALTTPDSCLRSFGLNKVTFGA